MHNPKPRRSAEKGGPDGRSVPRKSCRRSSNCCPRSRSDELGRQVGFIKRLRSVIASWFVWAVVLSRFGHGHPGFEQARDWYTKLTGRSVWPRPFQMRFKQAEAVEVFRQAFARAVAPWRTNRPRPRHALGRRFPDVVAVDSTLMQVADGLAPVFPGARAAAASLKVLLSISVFGALPIAAEIVAGHRHDMQLFPELTLFRSGTLLLFDKGFIAYERLRHIAHAGLHYLCPMRLNGNALIIGVHHAPKAVRRAIAAAPDGVWLRDLLPEKKRITKRYDLRVLVYPKTTRAADHSAISTRLVIVPGPNGEQRPYFTTLDAAEWTPPVLTELYRLRWQIELVFKELKQDLQPRTAAQQGRARRSDLRVGVPDRARGVSHGERVFRGPRPARRTRQSAPAETAHKGAARYRSIARYRASVLQRQQPASCCRCSSRSYSVTHGRLMSNDWIPSPGSNRSWLKGSPMQSLVWDFPQIGVHERHSVTHRATVSRKRWETLETVRQKTTRKWKRVSVSRGANGSTRRLPRPRLRAEWSGGNP